MKIAFTNDCFLSPSCQSFKIIHYISLKWPYLRMFFVYTTVSSGLEMLMKNNLEFWDMFCFCLLFIGALYDIVRRYKSTPNAGTFEACYLLHQKPISSFPSMMCFIITLIVGFVLQSTCRCHRGLLIIENKRYIKASKLTHGCAFSFLHIFRYHSQRSIIEMNLLISTLIQKIS